MTTEMKPHREAETTDRFFTHDVTNQSKPLEDYNLFTSNAALMEAVEREGADWAKPSLTEFGRVLGTREYIELANQANLNEPKLHLFDNKGNRLDTVEFHPAYHQVMEIAINQGIHSSAWSKSQSGAHVARAAACYLQSQAEPGVQCPITMTYGSVPAISKRKDLAEIWLPKIYSNVYDKRFLPVTQKLSAQIGMGMTEKQGGSDVRTNTTRAVPIESKEATAQFGDAYAITGHKWFFSAPMCDGFLILAQAPKGLSCFFLPRFVPDGTLNAIRIQRLKEKLGNRSNASSEVEFQNAIAYLIGEEGRGVQTIIEMATYTRLDCSLGSAGMISLASRQAINHSSYRTTFGKKLIDHDLMQNVLADLVLEAESATALSMRTAKAFDRQDSLEEEDYRRIVTPAAKYWICKRAPLVGAEAMEVFGGNGYVEEGVMARLYREMPLNSIWEGSGNVMCLDVLRAISKSKSESLDAIRSEWRSAKGANNTLDAYAQNLELELVRAQKEQEERTSRLLAEKLALCISASLLVRFSPDYVADAFCESRLKRDWGSNFGTLSSSAAELRKIIERGSPLESQS